MKTKQSIHQFIFVLTLTVTTLISGTASAQNADSQTNDNWQFDAQIYIWAADFSGELNNGATFDVPFDTLVDNLKMGFYGSFEARKDKWLIFTDVVYLNIATDETPAPPGSNFGFSVRDLKLKGGAVNLVGGYNLLTKGKSRLDLIAGARYLNLGSEFGLNVTFFGSTQAVYIPIDMGIALDGIVGAKGKYAFADRWSIPYHLDVGAGDSDLTWQVITGISYQAASWVDVALTYRHMEWDLTSTDGIVKNVNMSGPSLGATFHF
ncbi:MAG: hypothetical protein QNK24_13085 [Desulfuromusa sp.]|nr:hypothetical protein [Desulfuromusa sp.]